MTSPSPAPADPSAAKPAGGAGKPPAARLAARLGERLARWSRAAFGGGQWIGFALVIAFVGLRIWDPAPVEFVRLKLFDAYQAAKPRPVPEKQVMVVDIDEDSLKELGQWPWSRDLIADMTIRLRQAGAQVGFDVVFAEPDNLSPPIFSQRAPALPADVREALAKLPDSDTRFALVVKQTRSVLGMAAVEEAQPYRPKPTVAPAEADGVRTFISRYPGIVANIPVVQENAVGAGFFTVNPETDNIVRRVPMVSLVGDQIYPALALELIRVAFGLNTMIIKTEAPGGTPIGLLEVGLQRPGANLVVPVDRVGNVWPHYAEFRQDRYIPAHLVAKGLFDPALVQGKFVIFGASAAGLRDLRTTPVFESKPGVEVHAQLIESILNDELLRPWDRTETLDYLLVLGGGLALVLGFGLFGARWSFGIYLLIAGGIGAVSWWQFSSNKLLMDASAPVLFTFMVYAVSTYVAYLKEEKGRQQIKNTFGFYLSPAMVDKLADDPTQLKLGGEMRDMTILFSDVRGFTTISEMFDAQGLTQFMNRYLTPMTDIALANGAYIDKYIGDAIMAFWNAPLDEPNHAALACKTLLEMRIGVVKLNAELKAEAEANNTKYVPIAIGIGLNSGPCVVGNMGSTQKFNYSVLGDAVNLASRLEGQSKPYHVDNVIGEETYKRAPDFAALEIDLIRVKGKTVPVRIYTLVGDPALRATAEFQALAARHQGMLDAYRGQRWAEAEAAIEECRRLADPFGCASLYGTYIERMFEYRITPPPPDWDGVYVATSK